MNFSTFIRRLARLLSAVILLTVITGCGAADTLPEGVVHGSDGALCFAFSPSEYVGGFNALDAGAQLRPVTQWTRLTEDDSSSPFFGWSVLRFKPDESCLNDPAVMLFPSGDGEHVRALTFDLDDHAYAESSYDQFRRYCIGSIRLLTKLDGKTAEALFERLYSDAAEGDGWYPDDSGDVPRVIYICGSVGFFPYFRNGCMLRICAVPVDEAYVSALEASGTRVCGIDDLNAPAAQTGVNMPDTLDVSAADGLFAFTGTEFVSCYNQSGEFFRPLDSWEQPEDEEPPQGISPAKILRFREDAQCWTDPTVTLYLAQDERVCALSCDFNEHNYTEYGYALFRETFVRSVCLLTGCDILAGEALFDELYELADSGVCRFEPGETARPLILYRSGAVGAYSYYRAGMMCFVIVPVGEGSGFGCEIRAFPAA